MQLGKKKKSTPVEPSRSRVLFNFLHFTHKLFEKIDYEFFVIRNILQLSGRSV